MNLATFPTDWITAMEARGDTARVLQNLRDDACIEQHEAALRAGVTATWSGKTAKHSQDALDALKEAVAAKGLY